MADSKKRAIVPRWPFVREFSRLDDTEGEQQDPVRTRHDTRRNDEINPQLFSARKET